MHLVKVGNRIINLDNVAMVDLAHRGTFDGAERVNVHFVADDTPEPLLGAEGAALRDYLIANAMDLIPTTPDA